MKSALSLYLAIQCVLASTNPLAQLQQMDLNSVNDADPHMFVRIADQLLFVADNEELGRELWVTDGTTEGTSLLVDIAEGPNDSQIQSPLSTDVKCVLLADDGVHGLEPWIVDENGARMLADIRQGPEGSGVGLDEHGKEIDPTWQPVNDKVYFVANDGIHGAEIWVTDAGGTRIALDARPGEIPGSIGALACFQNDLYFIYGGQSLYRYNSVTQERERINEYYLVQDDMFDLQVADGKLFASVQFGNTRGGLSCYDGEIFRLIGYFVPRPGYGKTSVGVMESYFGELFFELVLHIAVDLNEYYPESYELWQSDGSSTHTTRLDFGDVYMYGQSGSVALMRAGNTSWRVSESGAAQIIEDMRPVGEVGFLGDRVFFTQRMEISVPVDNYELWTVNLSEAKPPKLVKDINIGSDSSAPEMIGAASGVMLFRADDGEHGEELWESDGTELGTRMVADIRPGPEGSDIAEGMVLGDQLIFAADDGTHGRELWFYRPDLSSGINDIEWLRLSGK